MRRSTRTAAISGVLLAALFGQPGVSAGTPTAFCASFIDDQRGAIEENVPGSHRDIRGGRLGSDGKQLTAVVALASLSRGPEQALLTYRFNFTIRGIQVFLDAPGDSSARPSFGVALAGRPVVLGEPVLVRDVKRKELRLSAPLTAFLPLVDLSAGAVATALNAQATLEPSGVAAPAVVRAPLIVLDLAEGRDTTYRFSQGACRSRR